MVTVKSETFDEECFKVLGASEKCAACNKCFETSHQVYEHMFLSKSQCYENAVSNLIKCGLEKDVKEIGMQRAILKIHGQLLYVVHSKKL